MGDFQRPLNLGFGFRSQRLDITDGNPCTTGSSASPHPTYKLIGQTSGRTRDCGLGGIWYNQAWENGGRNAFYITTGSY